MESAADHYARSGKCFDTLFEIIFSVKNSESLVFDFCFFLDEVCIFQIIVLLSSSLGYRDIFDFISFVISVFDFFDDIVQKLFCIFVEINYYIFFGMLKRSNVETMKRVSFISKKRGIHKEFHVFESVCFHVVNCLHISCEDVFRFFEKLLEEESVEKFFWSLNSSHQVAWFVPAGEERRSSISIRMLIFLCKDFSSTDDNSISLFSELLFSPLSLYYIFSS